MPDVNGNPTIQDVREGTASIDPDTGDIFWTVTVSAGPGTRPSQFWIWGMLFAGASYFLFGKKSKK